MILSNTETVPGKKIVAFKKCYGNWMRPEHGEYGRLSIGMYGSLEPFAHCTRPGASLKMGQIRHRNRQLTDRPVVLMRTAGCVDRNYRP